ncbi:MAG: condensation domain-containing protein [Kofleriaceae bacterium]
MITPLSFPQRRMARLVHLHQATGALHLSAALRLRGPLAVGALQHALDVVLARQDGLHVTLEPAGLREHAPAPIALARFAGATCASDVHDTEARRPFDLAAGPLIRAAVVTHAADDHQLLVTAHHLIFDGRSFGILCATSPRCSRIAPPSSRR